MYECMYVCMCMYIFKYVCVYVDIYVCIYISVNICIYECNILMCTYLCVRTYVYCVFMSVPNCIVLEFQCMRLCIKVIDLFCIKHTFNIILKGCNRNLPAAFDTSFLRTPSATRYIGNVFVLFNCSFFQLFL